MKVARPTPNYRIEHINGWTAEIYVPEKTEANLRSRNPDKKENARKAICTRFRMTCRAKGESRLHTPVPNWISWEHLTLTKLNAQRPALRKSVAPAQPAISEEGEKCDDCVLCERGDHHLCAEECTIGLRFLGR